MLLPESGSKVCAGNALEIGSLQDLRAAGKGGLDPNGDAVSSSPLCSSLSECCAGVPECCAVLVSQNWATARGRHPLSSYALRNRKHQQTALHITQTESAAVMTCSMPCRFAEHPIASLRCL